MNNKIVKLNKGRLSVVIPINIEKPYFRFSNLKLSNSDIWSQLSYILIQGAKRTESPITDNQPFEILVSDAESISFELELEDDCEDDFELSFEYSLINLISVISPFEEFDKHINSLINSKIFFSARFGQGKTFFLDYFFEEKEESYNAFKVFPVNYSVSDNLDIFKFIKVDLLLQLLTKGVEIEKDFSDNLLVEHLIISNPEYFLFNFLKMISIVSDSPEYAVLIKSFEMLKSIVDKVKSTNGKDKKEIDKFLDEAFQTEGSLFEDNNVTQLIRLFLEQFKSLNNKKKSVLVIEDLDRLDPEHIFRILNVISAHFDTNNYSHSNSANKFGFDKILLVGDINNIESIFKHKYGNSADFNGYMNKFYSSEVFKYNNTSMINTLIDKIDEDKDLEYPLKSILLPFINNELITLRVLFKLKNANLKKIKEKVNEFYKTYDDSYYFSIGLFTPIIYLISKQIGFNQFKLFVQFIKSKKIVVNTNYDLMTRFLLGAIGNENRKENKFHYYAESTKIEYIFNWDRRHLKNWEKEYGYAKEIFNKDKNEEIVVSDLKFNSDDFYSLLIENINYSSKFNL